MSETFNLNTHTGDDFIKDFLEFDEDSSIIKEVEDDGIEKIENKNPLEQTEDFDPFKITNEIPEDSVKDIEGEKEKNKIEEEKEEDNSSYSYKALLSHLNDEGLISFEDSEDLEDKPELIFESVKKTIDEGINSYKESIPELGKQFLDYLEQGGNPNDFINSLEKTFDYQNVDLTSEETQEKITREYLKTLDYSKEEIEETIQDYKDSLMLEKQSKIATAKLEKLDSKKQESLIAKQNEANEQRIQEYNKYIDTVNNNIQTATEIAGLSVNQKDKEAFKKYLLIPGRDGLTEYQRELQENQVQTQLELAFLKFKKYDFTNAKKQGESEASKKLKNVFKSSENTVKAGRGANQAKEQNDSLEAFRAFANKRK